MKAEHRHLFLILCSVLLELSSCIFINDHSLEAVTAAVVKPAETNQKPTMAATMEFSPYPTIAIETALVKPITGETPTENPQKTSYKVFPTGEIEFSDQEYGYKITFPAEWSVIDLVEFPELYPALTPMNVNQTTRVYAQGEIESGDEEYTPRIIVDGFMNNKPMGMEKYLNMTIEDIKPEWYVTEVSREVRQVNGTSVGILHLVRPRKNVAQNPLWVECLWVILFTPNQIFIQMEVKKGDFEHFETTFNNVINSIMPLP